ncbi:MAG: hypothetical protein IMF11_15940 [Proteobacteria bacterium]|nr:hypothetical protein [Pseudomonadota bacterium]
MEDKKIIEINGIKLEVDLRQAKRIDTFRIGDKVKILIKEYSEHVIYPGIVVGFEAFRELPTIVVAYVNTKYSSCELKFAYINAETKDVDMATTDDDYLPIEKASIIEKFDREIIKKEEELNEMKARKSYFLEHFQRYFEFKV